MMVKHEESILYFMMVMHQGVYFVFHDGDASESVFCIS